jgi:2,5-dihydroxypyridine 5,6-dioxygenase
MFADRIEGKWIDAFCEVFERCAVKPGDTAAILSETQSRASRHLAELAAARARGPSTWWCRPRASPSVPVRSTGASGSDRQAGARGERAGAGRLRRRLHHRGLMPRPRRRRS